MKKIILISSLFAIAFSGCTATKQSKNMTLETPQNNQIFRSKVLAKITTDETSTYPIPYVQRSKYIKILILPFKNTDNDIDYGGIIETKLEESKFVFDDTLKRKIVEKNNHLIGGI